MRVRVGLLGGGGGGGGGGRVGEEALKPVLLTRNKTSPFYSDAASIYKYMFGSQRCSLSHF